MEIKCKRKIDRTIITHKLTAGEQLNMLELEIVNKREIPGLEPVSVVDGVLGVRLEYVIRNASDIRSYLQSGKSFGEFARLTHSIIQTIRRCEAYGIRVSNLTLKTDMVFYNHAEKELHMLFWPLISLDSYADQKEFFYVMGQQYSWKPEDRAYQREYLGFFDDRSRFDLAMFEKTLSLLLEKWEQKAEKPEIVPVRGRSKAKPGGPADKMDSTVMLFTPILIRNSTGERIELNHFPFSVGRHESCDYSIRINNSAISRKHFIIRQQGRGLTITDNDSRNGTKLNGVRLTPLVEVQLKHGAVIEIGGDSVKESFTCQQPGNKGN